MMRGGLAEPPAWPGPNSSQTGGSASGPGPNSSYGKDPAHPRPSHGLDQFFGQIKGRAGLTLLDLGRASQASVTFITSLGHRLCFEDLLRSLDQKGKDASFLAQQSTPERVELFMRQSLDFPEQHFDGVLVWDVLEYLPPPLLKPAVDRLFHIVKPQSLMLAFFHAEREAEHLPLHSYRIADARNICLSPRGKRKPAQVFNNRGVERLFQRFHSVKFFLARDHLREVIVKR